MVARMIRILMAVTPVLHHVFVSAWPAKEANGSELVRALLERYDGRVVWADPPPPHILRALDIDAGSVVLVRKNSLRGVLAFISAEVSFFTHGVYGCPKPISSKPSVNLWHGDGPKTYTGARVPSTYVVSGSAVFGQYRADQFGVDHSKLLLTGMPRNAELTRPLGPEQLAELTVDPQRPFLVWMPTYRQARGGGLNGSWSDLQDTDHDQQLVQHLEPGLEALMDLGIQVVLKPHPLDHTSRLMSGLVVVTEDDLERSQATLYRLLAASSGLLTDYSSVWTDYLTLDRPIGFFFPDFEDYAATRGLYPDDAMQHLPGPILASAEDFRLLGEEILGCGTEAGRARRTAARDRFGLVSIREPAHALLDQLAQRGVLTVKDRN